MATVLVSVALVAASIRIAIRMESGLDSPAARALPADTGPNAARSLPLPAPRHETGRPTGALYPAFTPGQAPAAPPVPARAGRRPRR
jgi:predicted lysophospholipase L1 biosynthesis ABC-type transport system permease subunit